MIALALLELDSYVKFNTPQISTFPNSTDLLHPRDNVSSDRAAETITNYQITNVQHW